MFDRSIELKGVIRMCGGCGFVRRRGIVMVAWRWQEQSTKPRRTFAPDTFIPGNVSDYAACRHAQYWSYPDSVDRLWLSPPALG